MSSIAQEKQQVKSADYIFGDPPRCSYDDCHEPVFCYGFCFDHFTEEDTALWDAQRAERETCLARVGL